MTGISKATLTLPPTDLDGDGDTEQATFEFIGDLTVTVSQTKNYIIETAGTSSQVSALVGEYFDTGDSVELGDTKRKTFAVDAGGGAHQVEIDAVAWGGSDGQWGATGDDSQITAADATGAAADRQLFVLDRALSVATVGSLNPATLEVGEYSEDGLYGPLDVLVEQPSVVYNTEQSTSSVDVSLVCVETINLGNSVDALTREAF
jgi:hypothetical protein